MEHLPPVGWGDVATRRDLEHVEVALRREIESALRQQTNRMIGWLLASQATLVASVALIVGLR